MDVVAPVWQRAAEFGLLAFLLVLVMSGVGFAAWKIGNKVADATAESLKGQKEAAMRVADATDRTADAVDKIAGTTQVMAAKTEAWERSMQSIQSQVARQNRATRYVIDAVRELVPPDRPNVAAMLAQARSQLEE
jgi:hypothetical protein